MADPAVPAVAWLPRDALSRRFDKRLPMHDLNDIEAWLRRREELLREAENRRTIRPPDVVRPGESRRFGSVLLERAHARLPWRKGMAKC
jgi:hypothetical protein